MNQERSQIGVATLADAKQPLAFSAGMLARHEAEPSGKVSAITEGFGIADCVLFSAE